jgi:hypothetical protein
VRQALTRAARAGEGVDEDKAVLVRVIEYQVPTMTGWHGRVDRADHHGH